MKNTHAVALGRLGGSKGGLARAARLTPERRKAIAVHAAETRWERARRARWEQSRVEFEMNFPAKRDTALTTTPVEMPDQGGA